MSKSEPGKTGVGTEPEATTEAEAKDSAGERVDDVFDLPVVDEDTVRPALPPTRPISRKNSKTCPASCGSRSLSTARAAISTIV